VSGRRDKASDDDGDDRVFKALASPTRRRMLDILKQAPLPTGELCAHFPELDRTTALQHLRVLEGAELVIGRRAGRQRLLSLAPLPIKRLHDRWIGEYARAAVELLDDLDRHPSPRVHSPSPARR
jgi:DNA-binding transcriptional ArsR family regulator